jgi:hypothetical protein
LSCILLYFYLDKKPTYILYTKFIFTSNNNKSAGDKITLPDCTHK